jgi:hypothetical protein
MFVVLSLNVSMTCGEDDFPLNSTDVRMHMVTESFEKAQEFCSQLDKEYCLYPNTNKKFSVIEMPSTDFKDVHGTSCISMNVIYDTMTSML